MDCWLCCQCGNLRRHGQIIAKKDRQASYATQSHCRGHRRDGHFEKYLQTLLPRVMVVKRSNWRTGTRCAFNLRPVGFPSQQPIPWNRRKFWGIDEDRMFRVRADIPNSAYWDVLIQ